MATKIEYAKDKVIITVDYKQGGFAGLPTSKSGKTLTVASTGGFVPIDGAPDGLKINLNVTAPVSLKG